jgi:hypothetical protein
LLVHHGVYIASALVIKRGGNPNYGLVELLFISGAGDPLPVATCRVLHLLLIRFGRLDVLGGLVKENVAHRLVTVACGALLTHYHGLADALSGAGPEG